MFYICILHLSISGADHFACCMPGTRPLSCNANRIITFCCMVLTSCNSELTTDALFPDVNVVKGLLMILPVAIGHNHTRVIKELIILLLFFPPGERSTSSYTSFALNCDLHSDLIVNRLPLRESHLMCSCHYRFSLRTHTHTYPHTHTHIRIIMYLHKLHNYRCSCI